MRDVFEALAAGGALALGFSPLLALLGAAATACLLATGQGVRRRVAAWSLLVAVWLVGDGMRAVASARTLVDEAGSLLPTAPAWANGIAIALWALGGFALGYALPAWAGGYAGRQVTWGTGWLAAGAVSVGLSLAVASIAGVWG